MTSTRFLPLKSLKVLIADDDPVIADSMRVILGDYFDTVLVAKDGAIAAHLYEQEKPDTVILDIHMPGMNGLELARRLRANDPDLPIAILSCHDDREHLLEAVPLGLTRYLIKPVNLNALHELFQAFLDQLERRSRLRHKFSSGALYLPTEGKVFDASGAAFPLSRNEKRFLDYMLAHRGQQMDSGRLCQHLADDHGEAISPQGLRNLIHRLRGKIGKDAIHNHKDLGYRLP